MRQGITLITNAESQKSNVTAKEAAEVWNIYIKTFFYIFFVSSTQCLQPFLFKSLDSPSTDNVYLKLQISGHFPQQCIPSIRWLLGYAPWHPNICRRSTELIWYLWIRMNGWPFWMISASNHRSARRFLILSFCSTIVGHSTPLGIVAAHILDSTLLSSKWSANASCWTCLLGNWPKLRFISPTAFLIQPCLVQGGFGEFWFYHRWDFG